MDDTLLIAGIDPGTHKAYALVDLQGQVVDLRSYKDTAQSCMLRDLQHHGKIVVISSDVTPMPGGVRRIARQLRADTIEPDYNHQNLEKIKIVDEFLKTQKKFIEINNKHEKDALAAAVFGYKQLKPLLKKIEDHLFSTNKMFLLSHIKKKVLIEKIPITKAVKQAYFFR